MHIKILSAEQWLICDSISRTAEENSQNQNLKNQIISAVTDYKIRSLRFEKILGNQAINRLVNCYKLMRIIKNVVDLLEILGIPKKHRLLSVNVTAVKSN